MSQTSSFPKILYSSFPLLHFPTFAIYAVKQEADLVVLLTMPYTESQIMCSGVVYSTGQDL